MLKCAIAALTLVGRLAAAAEHCWKYRVNRIRLTRKTRRQQPLFNPTPGIRPPQYLNEESL
jgi:hypothetical protein